MTKNHKPTSKQSPKSLPKALTVLLTGFDPFGGDKSNPSQLVVESVPEILTGKARGRRAAERVIHIRKQILPTAGTSGWKTLKKAIDATVEQSEGPVIVLMLGLAAARKTISLERFALNFRDYSLADNDGVLRADMPVERGAPSLLTTNVQLRKLKAAMNAGGYPCDISNHAGTFICNELYFRALSYTRKTRKVRSVLFVHLPWEKVFAQAAKSAQNKQTPKDLARQLKTISRAGKANQPRLLQQAIVSLSQWLANDI